MWKICIEPLAKKGKISGSADIKKHKQILCSFITKYSATINIAFFLNLELASEDFNRFSDFFLVLHLLNVRQNPCLSVSCATRSVLCKQAGFRLRIVNITQTLLKKKQNNSRNIKNKNRTSVGVLGSM